MFYVYVRWRMFLLVMELRPLLVKVNTKGLLNFDGNECWGTVNELSSGTLYVTVILFFHLPTSFFVFFVVLYLDHQFENLFSKKKRIWCPTFSHDTFSYTSTKSFLKQQMTSPTNFFGQCETKKFWPKIVRSPFSYSFFDKNYHFFPKIKLRSSLRATPIWTFLACLFFCCDQSEIRAKVLTLQITQFIIDLEISRKFSSLTLLTLVKNDHSIQSWHKV